MKSYTWKLFFFVSAAAAFGDQLTVTGKTHDGTFQGYEDTRFQFMTVKGRFVKEHPRRVVKLVLANPRKASYVTADAQKEVVAVFKGYDKRKFIFLKDGEEAQVAQAKMKTLELVYEETAGGNGGEELAGGRYPIPRVDLNALSGGEINAAQQAALDKFKAAKQGYDDFVSQSSAMVAEMDKTTGAERENLLNQLRMRKNQEQPLKNSLAAAYKALTNVFAEPNGQ
ncbi:MAG: hypothetical protein QME60_02825 [Verrucomicrobiota bacterium]|nr:hypothetical protein [Verrucomicrobiota bacterium]